MPPKPRRIVLVLVLVLALEPSRGAAGLGTVLRVLDGRGIE